MASSRRQMCDETLHCVEANVLLKTTSVPFFDNRCPSMQFMALTEAFRNEIAIPIAMKYLSLYIMVFKHDEVSSNQLNWY